MAQPESTSGGQAASTSSDNGSSTARSRLSSRQSESQEQLIALRQVLEQVRRSVKASIAGPKTWALDKDTKVSVASSCTASSCLKVLFGPSVYLCIYQGYTAR